MSTNYDEITLGKGISLLERKDIPAKYRWRLNDIYENDEKWEEAFKNLKADIPKLGVFSGTLGESAERLLECFSTRDRISKELGRLVIYAHMKSHEDTADSKYQGLSSRVSTLAVEVASAESYITPEILSLSEETLKSYIENAKLRDYAFSLKKLLRSRAHILSPKEEALLAASLDMAGTAGNAFAMLTNADMKFPSIKDEEGNLIEMSEERAVSYLRSRRRSVRKAAFKSLYKPYNGMANTLGATFNGMLKSAKFYATARKYSSPLAAALDEDNIPESVYTRLVDTLESCLEPMHRYVRLRKKMLGVKQLHMYDIYTPLVDDPFGNIPWSRGIEIMFDALAPLGKTYLDDVKAGLAEGWIDVFANKGKRSGAYSWGSYGTHPYMLLNYMNNLNDVSTLVHEMGHSMHSFYSHKNQPYPTADYCIFTAEVASTVNEILLLSNLITKTEERNKKLYLLNRRLENIRTTVYRQTMFASFEREVHKRAAEGGNTTSEALKAFWHELNVKYYGDVITVDDELKIEWARIPHFYTPFYVYQYATGYSAAMALARGILEGGDEARERYLNFLTKGGSNYPIELLKNAGVDMSSSAPVESVATTFEETLDEMEKLF